MHYSLYENKCFTNIKTVCYGFLYVVVFLLSFLGSTVCFLSAKSHSQVQHLFFCHVWNHKQNTNRSESNAHLVFQSKLMICCEILSYGTVYLRMILPSFPPGCPRGPFKWAIFLLMIKKTNLNTGVCLENINKKMCKFYLVMLQEQKLAQHSQYWISDNVTNSEMY